MPMDFGMRHEFRAINDADCVCQSITVKANAGVAMEALAAIPEATASVAEPRRSKRRAGTSNEDSLDRASKIKAYRGQVITTRNMTCCNGEISLK